MEKAEFSVIIPTKNGFSFLDQTLWHLHEQTFRRFEVCICDDGSTDGTLEKIQIWKNKFEDIGVELKTCVTPALGAGAARNAALNLGKAPLVSFLDSDDFWAPNKLKTVYEIFEKHPNANAVSHCEEFVRLNGQKTLISNYCDNSISIPLQLYRSNKLSTSALTLRRSILVRNPVFDTSLEASQDYECWLSISQRLQIEWSPEVLGYYVEREGSISSRGYHKRFWCLIRIIWRYRKLSRSLFILRVLRACFSRQWFFSLRNMVLNNNRHSV